MQKMKVYTHPEADELKAAIPRLLAGIGWKKGMAYRDAGAAGDPNGFRLCAEQFLTVYNEYGDEHEKASTLIYNAGECYEAAYLLGQSVRWRKFLLEKFPNSEHYQKHAVELAGNYQAIAMYDKAAERMETYAEKYAKDKESPDFLRNAYLFRLGLGQNDQASANLAKYEGLYKKDNPELAAKIFWSKHDILKTDEEKLKHAEEYLKIYGKTGGTDRRIVAEATIGQILWRQSCDKGLLYDSCMSIQRKVAVAGEKARQYGQELKKQARSWPRRRPRAAARSRRSRPTAATRPRASSRSTRATRRRPTRPSATSTASSSSRKASNQDPRGRPSSASRTSATPSPWRRSTRPTFSTRSTSSSRCPAASTSSSRTTRRTPDPEVGEGVQGAGQEARRVDQAVHRVLREEEQARLRAAEGLRLDRRGQAEPVLDARRGRSLGHGLAELRRPAVPRRGPAEFKTEEEAYAFCDELSDKAQPHQEARGRQVLLLPREVDRPSSSSTTSRASARRSCSSATPTSTRRPPRSSASRSTRPAAPTASRSRRTSRVTAQAGHRRARSRPRRSRTTKPKRKGRGQRRGRVRPGRRQHHA
jgi:hypothetical protein